MKASKLYKYLDVDGGLAMLLNSNIQFTNATKLNDPFDCHPSLIDFANVPEKQMRVWGQELVMKAESSQFEQRRNGTWLCSLSKVNDSLLMWSYYSNHQGACIGLDMDKTRKCLSKILCSIFIGALEFDVQYKEIIEKPDFFKNKNDFELLRYQLSTKAKDWEHEKEVRLVLVDPIPAIIPNHSCMVRMALPYEPKDETKAVDWREVRAYHKICGECFESVYLGVNVDEDKRNQIIEAAKNLNPDIKIYQMIVDAGAFKLHTEQIC